MRTKDSKKVVSMLLTIVMTLALCINYLSAPVFAATTTSGGFQVSGTKLYDANGNEFVMRGVNYPHAWYTSQYTTAIPAIAAKGFNSVRIVLADGQQYSKTSYEEISALIDICKQNKLVAILEVHDATGSDSVDDLNNAVNYWLEMKSLLQGNEAYVILNIANEWYGTWDDGSTWKSGYISAIQTLRNAGIKNTIMIDCAGWGQYPQVISDHGKDVLAADSCSNTMFAIHMYEYAGGNESTVKNNIDNVLNKNLCLAIGEFGGQHTDGDVDEQTIMNYCQEKSVGWLAWSWTGNSSDLNYLDLCYDFAGNNLTEFGNQVINGTNGISQTSKICTIFTDDGTDDDSDDNTGDDTDDGAGDNTGEDTDDGSGDNTGDDTDDGTREDTDGGSGDNTGDDTDDGTGDNTDEKSYEIINIFNGESYADNWAQAVSVNTTSYGGTVDVTAMKDGDYIWVEYTGAYGDFDLVFESFSGGSEWAKISPSENGSTESGTYYAKFNYNDIVNVYGSDFTTVDRVHISSHVSGITVQSVDLVVSIADDGEDADTPDDSDTPEDGEDTDTPDDSDSTEDGEDTDTPDDSDSTEDGEDTDTPDDSDSTEDGDDTDTPEDGDDTDTPDDGDSTEDGEDTDTPDDSDSTEDGEDTDTPDDSDSTEDGEDTDTPDDSDSTEDGEDTDTPDDSDSTEDGEDTDTPDDSDSTEDGDDVDTPTYQNPFKDVEDSAWYAKSVQYVVENGLFTGTSEDTFTPNGEMTRGMLVTVLYRAAGRPEVTGGRTYSDVKSSAYYAKAVQWASSIGMATGYSDGNFHPNDPVTREQVAKILYHYAKYSGQDVTAKTDITGYRDYYKISDYAVKYMEWAAAEGVITGSKNKLNPKGNATRAEVASMLRRFIER